MRSLAFTLNGRPERINVDERRTLLWVLRSDMGLTGTKYGCGVGACGACTVVVGSRAVRSCLSPVAHCKPRLLRTRRFSAASAPPGC
jgi:aerobic-type carbon monoxide dehydrogenase small subunit (CoxS/CutS family)